MNFSRFCRRWTLFLILVVAILAACSTAAEREAQRIGAAVRDAVKQDEACRAPVKSDPHYARVYEKFGVAPGFPSQTQLMDNEVISDADIALALDWYVKIQLCNVKEIELLGRIDPQLAILQIKGNEDTTRIAAAVATPPQTYAEINRSIYNLRARTRDAVAAWGRGVVGRLQAEQQQELKARQQFLSEIGDVTEAMARAALVAVAALAEAQVALRYAQRNYGSAHPGYAPTYQIKTTRCQWIFSIWTCTES